MKFKLFGTEIYVSFSFFGLLTIMLYFDKTGLIMPSFLAVFLHESGHLFMMWKLGVAPQKIRLIPASVQIVNSHISGYENDVRIALLGPITNLVFFGVFHGFFMWFKVEILQYFSLINFCVGAFNLLPLKGLDGGVILHSFLCKNWGLNKAELCLKIITIFAGILLVVTAVLRAVFGNFNPSFLVVGIYLLTFCFLKA